VQTQERRIPYRRLVVAALVTAVVGGAVLLGWTWRHPQAFEGPGGWSFTAPKRQVGDTVYVGMSHPRGRDGGHVIVHGGHANIASGADNAEVELLLCTIDPDAEVGAIGSYDGDSIHRDCSALVPLQDQRMDVQYDRSTRYLAPALPRHGWSPSANDLSARSAAGSGPARTAAYGRAEPTAA
jgi:hypothetical protein